MEEINEKYYQDTLNRLEDLLVGKVSPEHLAREVVNSFKHEMRLVINQFAKDVESRLEKKKQMTKETNYVCPKCGIYGTNDQSYCPYDRRKLVEKVYEYPEYDQEHFNKGIDTAVTALSELLKEWRGK